MRIKVFISAIIFLIILLVVFPAIMYSNKRIVCAQYKSEFEGRGSKYIKYSFEINGEELYGNFEANQIDTKDLREFKMNKKCLDVEVSNYIYFFNRLKKN